MKMDEAFWSENEANTETVVVCEKHYEKVWGTAKLSYRGEVVEDSFRS